LTFTSPGDDLLCGTPAKYEVATAEAPITPASFAAADAVDAKGDAKPAGTAVALDLAGAALKRYVAVRAVDDQGNVGRPAAVDTAKPAEPAPPAGGSPAPQGDGSPAPHDGSPAPQADGSPAPQETSRSGVLGGKPAGKRARKPAKHKRCVRSRKRTKQRRNTTCRKKRAKRAPTLK
jgi:hypothetical protein